MDKVKKTWRRKLKDANNLYFNHWKGILSIQKVFKVWCLNLIPKWMKIRRIYEKTITLLDVNKNLNVLRRERKHCLFWYCFPLFFTPWVFYILVPWFLLLTIQSFNFILIYLNLKLKKCSAPFFWWDLQAHLNGKGGFHANLFFFFLILVP